MIQIIDGFKLNASTPIDSRFVVADDTERMAITYLYHGLRVWELDTNTPYFYDGTQWISELDLVVTGSGTLNSIPKIIDDSPVEIGDSQISDDGTTVTIATNLVVGGVINFTSLDGVIDADKITMGTLTLDRLETQPGTDGYVLQMEGSVPKWKNLSGITIGTSENAEKVTVDGTTSTDYRLILRLDSSPVPGPTLLYSNTNTNGLKLRQDGASELRILAHDGTVEFPSYSFDSNDDSGIYYLNSDSSINVSIDSDVKLKINNNGVSIKTSQYDNPDANENPIVFNNINSIGVPIGGIIIWSGDPANIGTGNLWNFAECDGTSTPTQMMKPDGSMVDVVWSGGSNLPDLEGRFALGSGGVEYEFGTSGGSSTITDENLPLHTHSSGSLETGNHENDQEGWHRHTIDASRQAGSGSDWIRRTAGGEYEAAEQSELSTGDRGQGGSDEGAHEHNIHGDTGDGEFANTDFMPPYYVVTYIIRLA